MTNELRNVLEFIVFGDDGDDKIILFDVFTLSRVESKATNQYTRTNPSFQEQARHFEIFVLKCTWVNVIRTHKNVN